MIVFPAAASAEYSRVQGAALPPLYGFENPSFLIETAPLKKIFRTVQHDRYTRALFRGAVFFFMLLLSANELTCFSQ